MSDAISTSITGARAARDGAAQAAIAQAARRTGVDFGYLLAQARLESGLDPDARAGTSSASGLFQFIDQTWLATLDRHGEALGYGEIARAINSSGGRSRVSDPAMREAILQLRFDPQASSLMAGALAADNRAALGAVLGREPDASELYLAHFLGENAAGRFLQTLASAPDARAAQLLPAAASANRAIFFGPGGTPRTVGEVMALVRQRVEGAMAERPSAAPPVMAAARQADAPLFAQSSLPALPALPRLAPTSPARSMADTIGGAFGLAQGESGGGPAHVRRAYARLQAFGL